MKLWKKLADSLRKALTVDMTLGEATSAFINVFLAPVDVLCERLAKRYAYFRPTHVRHTLFENFEHPTSDERENFIPIRLGVFLDALTDYASGDASADERKKWEDFMAMSAARFHYDAIEQIEALRDVFAPFDPDADTTYELKCGPKEREEKSALFFDKMDAALTACNYMRLPSGTLERLLQLKRPGALPMKSCYDDFLEYRVYARGVRETPVETFPRWKTLGKDIRIQSEIISRVCVVAKLRDGTMNAEEDGQNPDAPQRRDRIVLKLFKDVTLEHMNLVAPRVQLKFPLLDGLKISFTFSASSGTAIMKIILASAFTPVLFAVTAFAFVLAFIKSALGFVHRRTLYLQKFSSRLYYHMLASNHAVIDSIIAAAIEQETKEYVLGYVAALKLGDWSTEREIDDAAEAWLLERFGAHVDFESSDALRKLKEKGALEEREDAAPDGTKVMRYRVRDLDEVLRHMDEVWDNFFTYSV